MEEQKGQSRFFLFQGSGNEFAIRWLVAKQDFYGFGPGAVNLLLAYSFVAIAEVQANKPHELANIVLGGGLY
jgi:hypothetical protein